MSSDVKTLTEQLDEIAAATLAETYRAAVVEPGDHLGYFLKRQGPADRVIARLRSGERIAFSPVEGAKR